jgi:hypothetical protein
MADDLIMVDHHMKSFGIRPKQIGQIAVTPLLVMV